MKTNTIIKLEQPGGNIYVKESSGKYHVSYDDDNQFEPLENFHSSHDTLARAMESVVAMIEGNIKNGFYAE